MNVRASPFSNIKTSNAPCRGQFEVPHFGASPNSKIVDPIGREFIKGQCDEFDRTGIMNKECGQCIINNMSLTLGKDGDGNPCPCDYPSNIDPLNDLCKMTTSDWMNIQKCAEKNKCNYVKTLFNNTTLKEFNCNNTVEKFTLPLEDWKNGVL